MGHKLDDEFFGLPSCLLWELRPSRERLQLVQGTQPLPLRHGDLGQRQRHEALLTRLAGLTLRRLQHGTRLWETPQVQQTEAEQVGRISRERRARKLPQKALEGVLRGFVVPLIVEDLSQAERGIVEQGRLWIVAHQGLKQGTSARVILLLECPLRLTEQVVAKVLAGSPGRYGRATAVGHRHPTAGQSSHTYQQEQ